MKLKSDPKTGCFTYIVAFGFLLFIAVDIAKSLNEVSPPPQPVSVAPVVIAPQYTQISIPVSQQEGTKSYHLMQSIKEGSTIKFLYKVTYKIGNDVDVMGVMIPDTASYFVRAETMCQLNTFRHMGQSETIENISGEGLWYEPKQGDNVFDIIKFVCANTK
jgi:hypothetical protein